MTSYFYGNAHFNGTYMKNVLYQHGNIQATNIDMDMRKITTLATPTNDFDGANKLYVDQKLSSVIEEWIVQLTGSTYVEVAELRPASYFFSVSPLEGNAQSQGGPTANFSMSKSNSAISGDANILSSSKSVTGERLQIKWLPDRPFSIRKTGENFDGLYLVQKK